MTIRKIKVESSSIKTLIAKTLADFKKRFEATEPITGLQTGFRDLDNLMLGLQPAELVVIASRPALGKTAFASNIAVKAGNQSQKQEGSGKKAIILYFSLELTKEQLSARILLAESKVNYRKWLQGNLTESDWNKIFITQEKLSKIPLYFIDVPQINPQELATVCNNLKDELGCNISLIIIDYFQLMAPDNPAQNRNQELDGILHSLKKVAKEQDTPVLLLSQLNRRLERRLDKRPMLSDLSNSGAIEEFADKVLFIYRDEVYNKDSPYTGTAEIILAKNKTGPTGYCVLSFIGKQLRFADLDNHPTTPD